MPTVRLNNKTIAAIQPPESRTIYWDEQMKCFGLRVTPSLTKTFVVQGRVNGRDCFVTIGKFGTFTVESAKVEAKKALARMAEGIDPNKAKASDRAKEMTLAEVFAAYIKRRQLRETTLSVYEGAIRRCFPDWRNKPISQITKDMIERRYDKICNANGPRSTDGKAHASQAMRMLGSLFNYAMDLEGADGQPIIIVNPVKRLSKVNRGWSRGVRRQGVILDSELSAFYQAVQQLRYDTARDYLMLLILTGLRRNEAAGLRWDEINLTEKKLVIPKERSKNKRAHVLPLTPYLLEMLTRRKLAQMEAGDPHQGSEYVFPGNGRTGHYVESKTSVTAVSNSMTAIKKYPKKFMCHDLRRTFTTAAERLDIGRYTLQYLLNHTSSDVTGGYIVSDVERFRKPMNRINAYILERMEIDLTPLSTSNVTPIVKNTKRASSQDA